MNQTAIEQAVIAHRAGNLQEAEAAYRAILLNDPKHPDANHNLGVLAISLNKSATAIPLLKTALESNPRQAQYWISYIDALIRDQQFEFARIILEKGKINGLVGKQVDALSMRLDPKNEKSKQDETISQTVEQQHKEFSVKKSKSENLKPSKKNFVHGEIPQKAEVESLIGRFQKGHHRQAEELAAQMTYKYPKYPFGWKMLGAVYGALGCPSKALKASKQALVLAPKDLQVYSNLANTLLELGMLEEAEELCRKAISIEPHDATAFYNLGNVLHDLGQLEDAEASYKRAVAINPKLSEAYSNLGTTLLKLDRLVDAESSCRQAITQNPKLAAAHSNLGIALQRLNRLTEAESSYRKAVTLEPTIAETHHNLGLTLLAMQQPREAAQSFRCAISLKSDVATIYNDLGVALQKLNQPNDAATNFSKAIQLKPDFAAAYANLGVSLNELGELKAAESNFRQAIELNPDDPHANNNLGYALRELGQLKSAEESYRRALTLNPLFSEAHANLAVILYELNRTEEAEAANVTAIELNPHDAAAHSNLILGIASTQDSHLRAEKAARQFGLSIKAKVSRHFDKWNCLKKPSCLRVGLVSGDFQNHPVGFFLEAFLSKCDNSKIEFYGYTTSNRSDSLTKRIRPYFVSWQILAGKNDEEAASMIQRDGVHVLFDLSGHTKGNRLPVFAYKPAPVQVSWLGYFGTTGLTEMDYILGDPNVTPISESEHFTEKIWRLPESYLCFTPPEFDLEISPLPAKSTGFITFGCFNKPSKVTDEVIAVWAKILKAIPNSKLFLKGQVLNEQVQKRRFEERFELHEISSDRLILEGKSKRADLLACYRQIDVALDPFPYPGGTTSVESLWMGVPVLTMRGTHFLSHVGETIAINSGLPGWIATDGGDYVARAVALTSDLEKLNELRMGLRGQVLSSPLFDSTRFAKFFELAVWKMWEKSNESTS
jgi:protein O-GlcNAc transferase